MESNEKTSTYFLTVNGEKVMVSRGVYQMIREENNHKADDLNMVGMGISRIRKEKRID